MTGKKIDIVYAADHAYFFLCCVSMLSLMQSLPPWQEARIHLLTDESFCTEDERLLVHLSKRFPRLEILRHNVAEATLNSRDFKDSLWSKAICYRLVLPELLLDVDICLYLDADTLIVGDILPLWDIDMENYFLAGVFDDIAPVRQETVGHRIPGIRTYVNSGVLLMNLALMRERNLQEKFLRGITDYLVVDQDLLNVVCYGRIRLLPSSYNCIPGVHMDSPKILHFLMRDYVRPWKNRRAAGSDLWWRVAEDFVDVYDLEHLRRKADWYQRGSISYLLRRCADFSEIYVIGSGRDARQIFRALRLGKCKGLKEIRKEEDCQDYASHRLLIVASQQKDIPALASFLERKGGEEQVIRYEKRPVSFYNLLPDECKREVYGELLMWEFGVDSRGVASCAALLELNAARFPDKEALVEWRDSDRRVYTWRGLNRMANRMADWLGKQRLVRGTFVRLPEELPWGIDMIAALWGIFKSGCAVDFSDSTNGRLSQPAMRDPVRSGTMASALVVDMGALTDERNRPLMPPAETQPDEKIVLLGEENYSGRDICALGEDLRRRLGWHRRDRLMLCQGEKPSGHALIRRLTELSAAFAHGSATVLTPFHAERMMELLRLEKATILSMDASAFIEISEGLKPDTDAGELRMVLAEEPSVKEGGAVGEALPRALQNWNWALPHVPVNGQGHEGGFRYDCEWY